MYTYDVNSETGKPFKGLLIELQYRTIFQHAWATAVEVVGFITESQPKFQEGDKRFEVALSYASEIIARAFENGNASHPTLTNEEVVHYFLELDEQLGLMAMLRALNATDSEITIKKNVILILDRPVNGKIPDVETRSYRDATEAMRALFQLEKELPNKDIVLVKADSSDEIRNAFRNYFSDAREFVSLIDDGCQTLPKRRILQLKRTSK